MVVGFDVGGGYDLYARTVARHWSRHIPGNPNFVPQNMPGAGTRTAANWLYNVAPKDGTAVGTIVQSAAVDQALGEPGIRYDAAQFNWIGNPIVDNLVTLSWAASGLATLDDVKSERRPVLRQHRRRTHHGVSARDQPAPRHADQGDRGLSRPERRQHRDGAQRSELHRRHHLVVGQGDDAAAAGGAEDQSAGAMGHRRRTRRFPPMPSARCR